MGLLRAHKSKTVSLGESSITNKLVILMGLFSLLPMVGNWYYIRVALPALILAVELIMKRNFSVRKEIIVFFLLWGISLFGSQLIVVGTQTSANIIAFRKEILRLIVYLIIALSVQKYNVNFKILTGVSVFMLIFHFGIQMLQFFKYEIVFDFIINNYMDGTNSMRHLGLAYNDTLANFRSGSIFINPNVYVPYAMFFLVVFLQNVLNRKSITERSIYMILSLLSGISIVFCGSRTGFIGMIIITILYLTKDKKMPLQFKIIFEFVVLFILYYVTKNSDARLLQISSGLEDSYGGKMSGILHYIYNINPISFFIGNNINIGSNQWHYDFEWGYIFVYYGILGLFFYTFLHRMIIKRFNNRTKNMNKLKFFNQGILILFIVESMSATVFMNLPVFYFLSIVFFAKEIMWETR